MFAWQKLVQLPAEQFATLDIAIKNLACADGLPGCERINHKFCLGWLDEAAELIRRDTPRRMHLFLKDPKRWNNSESQFRTEHMVTILQRDLRVRYNPEKIAEDATLATEDVFIHGVIQGKGGTCASVPVVCVAVGRRLGYPLKLVKAKSHVFFRWDSAGERFNCEATNHGAHSQPDDYYRRGRYECTPQEEYDGCHLVPLSPRQEFGDFLIQRGWLWLDQKNVREAAHSFMWGADYFPNELISQRNLTRLLDGWRKELESLTPQARPIFRLIQARRIFQSVPVAMEKLLLWLTAWEDALHSPRFGAAWEEARRNPECWPAGLPREIDVKIGM